MKQESSNTLQSSITAKTGPKHGLSFAQRINDRFKGLEGQAIVAPQRQAPRALPSFNKP
jgi:hypothetical protein